MSKLKPIPRPVRNLAARLKEWATVDDAFIDFGETNPTEVAEWAERFFAQCSETHEFRTEWIQGEQYREAVWANWERLRGKNLRQRAEEYADRHNARLRAKYGMFATTPELLAEINVRFADGEKEYQKWLATRERIVADRKVNGPAKPFSVRDHYHAIKPVDMDAPLNGEGSMSLNQLKVWRWLHGCDGFTPSVQKAMEILESLGVERIQANWATIYAHAARIWDKSEREKPIWEEMGAGGKITQSWPQFRAWIERDWPAIQQMNQLIEARRFVLAPASNSPQALDCAPSGLPLLPATTIPSAERTVTL